MTYWTEEEDAVLQERYYSGGSWACIAVLTDRTRRSIIGRARRLGLHSVFNTGVDRIVVVGATSSRDYWNYLSALRPSHLPKHVKVDTEEANRLCNEAYIKAVRREHGK